MIRTKADGANLKTVVILTILAASVAYMVSSGLKVLVEAPRPCVGEQSCPDSYSFPSRHTTIAFSMAAVLIPAFRKRGYTVLLLLAAAAVGYWRLSIGVHTLEDVVGGAVIGAVIGAVVYFLSKSYKKRRESRHPGR